MARDNTLGELLHSLQNLRMDDPIAHMELKLKLASDPELANRAEDILEPHRVPLSAVKREETVGTTAEGQLQMQMQRDNHAFQAVSNILKTLHDPSNVARNLR